ncbi:MAG: YncE family protein [Myxococcota bacterium]
MLRKILTISLAALMVTAGCAGQDDPLDEESEQGNNGAQFDAGGNNGGSDDVFVPEEQAEFRFSKPAVVDGRVYVANESLNAVAVIDSESLSIDTRLVGFAPREVVGPDPSRSATAEDARVAVLNEGSFTVSLIDPGSEAGSDGVTTVPVMRQANRIAMEPTGRSAVAWYDPSEAKASDPAGDLSSVSLIKGDTSHSIAVGFSVRDVFFDDVGETALVLTDDGISVIDIAETAADGIAPPLRTVPAEMEPDRPQDLETLVTPDGAYALTRSSTFSAAVLLDIEADERYVLELPERPTDIDLVETASGLELLMMLRERGQALRMTVPDGFINAADVVDIPEDDGGDGNADAGSDDAGMDAGTDADAADATDASDTADADTTDADTTDADDADAADGDTADASDTSDGDADAGDTDDAADAQDASDSNDDAYAFPDGIEGFDVIDIEVPGMGAASIASDSETALLFTSAGSERRAVILALSDNSQRTVAFEKEILGALPDAQGTSFVVIHDKQPGDIPADATPADPEYIARSWGVSALDIESAATRLVLTKHRPTQFALWAGQDASRMYATFEGPNSSTEVPDTYRDVLELDLSTFRTETVRLPSLPDGLGVIPEVDKVYVSQKHPQGRITFISTLTRKKQTVTGYQLNAGID